MISLSHSLRSQSIYLSAPFIQQAFYFDPFCVVVVPTFIPGSLSSNSHHRLYTSTSSISLIQQSFQKHELHRFSQSLFSNWQQLPSHFRTQTQISTSQHCKSSELYPAYHPEYIWVDSSLLTTGQSAPFDFKEGPAVNLQNLGYSEEEFE